MITENNQNIDTNNKADCMILNLWYSLNYGAGLTCYGTLCLMNGLGLNAKVINFVPQNFKNRFSGSFSEKFGNKYLNLTNPCVDYFDLAELNNNCNTFITGSDQVWGAFIRNNHNLNSTLSTYMLDFVEGRNKKLSYAASFGVTSLENHQRETVRLMKYFLPQFDCISVREDEGKTLLKNDFNLDAEQHIDGAFHIPKDKLEEMAAQYPNKNGDYMALFSLPYFKDKSKYSEIINRLGKQLNLPVNEWEFDITKDIEEWLSFIKNAKFVITDSFHGVVFSIIFNIPFVQIINAVETQSRFETLFRSLGIKNNSIKQNNENIDWDNIIAEYDWSSINAKIKSECKRAEEWMHAALNTPVKNRPDDTLNYLIAKDGMTAPVGDMPDNIASLNKDIKLLAQKEKIFRKYYRYKILSKILLGKKREHYKQKRGKYKSYVRRIRKLAR